MKILGGALVALALCTSAVRCPAAPADSSTTRRASTLPADSLVVPRSTAAAHADSAGRRPPITIVRVPLGQDPSEPPDTTEAPEAPSPAGPGSGPESRLFVLVGLGFPLGPPSLTDQWDPGGTFGAGADLLLEPRFGMRLRGEWAQLPYNQRRFLQRANLYGTGAAVEGGAASLVLISAEFHLRTRRDWLGAYVEAGPGVGMFRHGDAIIYDAYSGTLSLDPGETEFLGGASAGAGMQLIRRDGSGLFFDVHWSALFPHGPAIQYIPFTVGLLFQ